MKYVVAVLILIVSCVAQSALVVPLKPEDVANISSLHQEMVDAEKRWADVQNEIKLRYIVVDKDDPEAGDATWYPPDNVSTGFSFGLTLGQDECDPRYKERREQLRAEQDKQRDEREAHAKRFRKGWGVSNCIGCDAISFEYTTDFRFIVPKPPTPKPNPYGGQFVIPAGQ